MTKSPLNQVLADLVSSIKRYISIHITLLKLEVIEKSAKLVSLSIAVVLLLTLLMFFLLFVSLAAATWLAELLGNQALGYLCVAGFYFLVGVIIYALRRKLFVGTVIRLLSEIFFEDQEKTRHE